MQGRDKAKLSVVARSARAGAIAIMLLGSAHPATADEGTHTKPFSQVGHASWYHHREPGGRKTASGQRLDDGKLTAAHKFLPLNSQVVVTNLESGKSVIVTINDRGPYRRGRIIDLSRKAAQQIGITHTGTAKVRVETVIEVAETSADP